MNERNHQYFSCERKIAYENWEVAEKACIKVMDEGIRQTIMAYKCLYSEHWHIGHNPSVIRSHPQSKERSTIAQRK